MAQIKAGDIHSFVLKGINYDLDRNRQPRVEFGVDGTPQFRFDALARDAFGRDHDVEVIEGPNNITEANIAIRAWVLSNEAAAGRWGRNA